MSCLGHLADQSRDVMQIAGACDGAAQQGYALDGIARHAGGYRECRADGSQESHDELDDVLNGFFLLE